MDKQVKIYDKILSGREIVEMGFYKDNNGYLIATTFTYGVYFPIRSYNIIRINPPQKLKIKHG